jgi:lipoprotein-releasing system permease protein
VRQPFYKILYVQVVAGILIGVALGVATLIIVLSVMGGFRQQLLGRIIGLNGHIVITARDGGMAQATPELLAKLKAFPGVRAVNLTLERQALVTAGNQTRGALLRGVRPEDLQSRDMLSKSIVQCDLGSFGTRPGVVIGERLRQALNLRAGDKITLVTHRLNDNGTISPRYTDYDVLASFLTRRHEFDNGMVFVPLAMLQDDLEYGKEAVSSIDLDIADPAAAPQLAEELRKALGRDDLRVAHWLGLNARFVGALQVERVMMFIILTLIVVVAAMNVVASFTMLVRVKRGSIAILLSLAAAAYPAWRSTRVEPVEGLRHE